MKIEASSTTLGAVVADIDLRFVPGTSLADDLREALGECGVLVFPEQQLDDEGQLAVAELWGEARPHPVVAFLGGTEKMGVVFNDENHEPPPGGDSAFHTDYSFNHEIPDIAVLRPVTIPPFGGGTGWADAREALSRLAPATRERVRGMKAHHDAGERFAVEMEVRMGKELAARVVERFGGGWDHPIIARHPRTGDELLFVNPGFTRSIVGLEACESEALLSELYATFGDPSIQFEHRWSPGDIVIWDEHRTVHRGPNDFGNHRRELRRCTAGQRAPRVA